MRLLLLLACVLVLLAGCAAKPTATTPSTSMTTSLPPPQTPARDWLLHRGDAAHTGWAPYAESSGAWQLPGVYSPPAVAADGFYASTATHVAAFGEDGGLRWERDLPSTHPTSPILWNGSVIAVGSGKVLALSSAGELRWQAPVQGEPASPPASDGRSVYVMTKDVDEDQSVLRLYAFGASGTQAWAVLIGRGDGRPLNTDGERVYYGRGGEVQRVAAYAVDGHLVWDVTTQGSDGGPLLMEGQLFYSSGTKVVAADPTTGAPSWEKDLASPVRGELASARGRVFALTADGRLSALENATGNVVWARPVGVPGCQGAACSALAPATDGERVVVASGGGRLVTLDWDDGAVRSSVDSVPGGAVTLLRNSMLLRSDEGQVRVLA